jgi:hypothetical protein
MLLGEILYQKVRIAINRISDTAGLNVNNSASTLVISKECSSKCRSADLNIGRGTYTTRAQAYTEIQAASHLVYNAARKKEAGEDFILDAAMVCDVLNTIVLND